MEVSTLYAALYSVFLILRAFFQIKLNYTHADQFYLKVVLKSSYLQIGQF